MKHIFFLSFHQCPIY